MKITSSDLDTRIPSGLLDTSIVSVCFMTHYLTGVVF